MVEHIYQGHTIIEHEENFYVFPFTRTIYQFKDIFERGMKYHWYMFKAPTMTRAKNFIMHL